MKSHPALAIVVSGLLLATHHEAQAQTDPLKVEGDTVTVRSNLAVVGTSSGKAGALVDGRLSLGNGLANTKLSLWDNGDPSGNYGLGIQANQFRFHTGAGDERFSFLNAPDGGEIFTIQDSGKVGIGVANPSAMLQIGAKPVDSGSFTAEMQAAALFKSATPNVADSGNTAPESALILAREGKSNVAYANFARFDLSRASAVGMESRTQLDLKLSHGDLGAEGNNTPTVLSLRSDGTVVVPGKIQVDVEVRASAVNGALPPYSFDIGDKNDTGNWHAVQIDSATIKKYLGGPGGGTIRICFRVNSTDEVRIIEEAVYIEQRDRSNKARPGLTGYTRQLGGGDMGFILGTAAQAEVIPYPWDWMWVRNYSSGGGPGLPAASSSTWTKEDDLYRLEFLTPPNVSATVILYNR